MGLSCRLRGRAGQHEGRQAENETACEHAYAHRHFPLLLTRSLLCGHIV